MPKQAGQEQLNTIHRGLVLGQRARMLPCAVRAISRRASLTQDMFQFPWVTRCLDPEGDHSPTLSAVFCNHLCVGFLVLPCLSTAEAGLRELKLDHLLFHLQGLYSGHEVAGHIAFSPCDERLGQPPVSSSEGGKKQQYHDGPGRGISLEPPATSPPASLAGG